MPHPTDLPRALRRWPVTTAGARAALARAVTLRLCELHGLLPGALDQLLGTTDLARSFWQPPGAAGALLAALLPPVAHAPPKDMPEEAAVRELLLVLHASDVTTALRALQPRQLSPFYEHILAGGTHPARRAAGVYYTPGHIVDYIIGAAVMPLLNQRSSAAGPRVLDPACGAGAFLAAAYRAQSATPHSTAPAILGNLYGIDIDPYAVAATRLTLLLAALHGQAAPHPNEVGHLLSILAARIVWGNALIAHADAPGRADALDWASAFPEPLGAGGFDTVIGNPPYLNLKRGALSAADKRYFATRYGAARGQYDTFALFAERAVELLAPGGMLAFVVPRPLLAAQSYAPARRLLLAQQIVAIADAGAPFADAAVEVAVVVVRKAAVPSAAVRLERLQSGAGTVALGATPQTLFAELPAHTLSYRLNQQTAQLIRRLVDAETRLADLLLTLTRGLELGKRAADITRQASPGAHPLLRGQDVSRYLVRPAVLGYRPHSPPLTLDRPQILVRRVAGRIEAAITSSASLTLNTLYTLTPRPEIDAFLLLGILNARLLTFFLHCVYLADDRLFPYLRISQLAALPMPSMAAIEPAGAARRAAIAAAAQDLQALHTQLHATSDHHEKAALQRRSTAIEQQIDTHVYQLYGLSNDDIALIEAPG